LRKIEDLIEKARKLKEKGLTTGEIADELNVSEETALWLLTKAKEDLTPPSDIYIDWRSLSNPIRLRNIAMVLSDLIYEVAEDVEVVVGIATSGIPIATMVAEEIGAELAIYYPRKLKFEKEKTRARGFLSENFARVEGKRCIIVDDIISTGSTLKETAEFLSEKDSKVLCVAVMIDKKGIEQINEIPVFSLLKVITIHLYYFYYLKKLE